MKCAAVTGFTGYLGNQLARRLRNENVRVVPIQRGETTDSIIKIFEAERPEIVFHLASYFVAEHQTTEIESLILSNVMFGTQVLEAMKQTGVRQMVNTGTAWQHFERRSGEPVCLYSATKNAFEEILNYYAYGEGFRVLNLEIFDTYGPGDPRPKLIPKLLRQTTFQMPEGYQRLHFVHLEDILRAFLRAAELIQEIGEGGAFTSFSLPSLRAISLRELVELMSRIRQVPFEVSWGARSYRRREVMEPWSPFPSLPGWTPTIDLEVGLSQLVNG